MHTVKRGSNKISECQLLGLDMTNAHWLKMERLAVTTQWRDSDGVVTVDNCQQHGDYTVDLVTVLPAVNNGDYAVTV